MSGHFLLTYRVTFYTPGDVDIRVVEQGFEQAVLAFVEQWPGATMLECQKLVGIKTGGYIPPPKEVE